MGQIGTPTLAWKYRPSLARILAEQLCHVHAARWDLDGLDGEDVDIVQPGILSRRSEDAYLASKPRLRVSVERQILNILKITFPLHQDVIRKQKSSFYDCMLRC